MAITLTVNGTSYSFPTSGENPGWGSTVTSWAQAVSQATLQKSGGSFTLTADVDFGANYGIKLAVLKSRTANAAQSGLIRLANSDQIKFRNSTNTTDLALGVGSTDTVPAYAGKDLVNVDATQTLTGKTMSGASNTFSAIPWSSVDKTSSNISDLATKSHTSLSDIGTNSHSTIDSFISNAPSTYAPIGSGVTNGDSHDHSGGDGAQIDHTKLSNIGTNTHAQIDTHISEDGLEKAALTQTGFVSWGSGATYYTITGGKLQVDRSGTGYVKGVKVTWTAGQQTGVLAANTTTYVYMNSAGTIGTTTSATQATYEDYIILFEVLYDGTNYVVVAENHPYKFNTAASVYLHNTVGPAIAGSGAVITRVATGTGGANADREVKIVGAATLEDHGLSTTISDSAGAGVTWNQYHTNASGKWIRDTQSTQLAMKYNNAGTATALGSGEYGVYVLYVSKSDLNTSTPTYYAVMNNAKFANAAAAGTAITNNTIARSTNELASLELAQLGYAIVKNSGGGYIDSLTVAKATVNQAYASSGTNQANLVVTNVTAFNGALSSADTTVQAALDTLDDAVATKTGTQTLTNKDIDGGTASNTNRITVPKDTKANLDALTRKEGTIVYGTDTDKLYADDGSTLKAIGAAGSGSGETNYVTNPSGVDDNAAAVPTGWANVGDLDIVVTKTAADLPRENITKSGLKITADANTQSAADYVYYDFTLDDVDASGRIMKLKWDQKITGTYTAGQLEVVITTQADRTTAVATPFTSAIPSSDGTFQTYFLAPSTATCSLVIRATADMTTDGGIVISDVVVGPNVQVQGAAIGAWKSFSPVTKWVSNVNWTGMYREVGGSIECMVLGEVTGTPTSSDLEMDIPSGFTIDTTKLPLSTTTTELSLGTAQLLDSGSQWWVGGVHYIDTNSVRISHSGSGNAGIVSASQPFAWGLNDRVGIMFAVPVNELSSNVTLANRAVEVYAADDGSSDVFGPNGALVPNQAIGTAVTRSFVLPDTVQKTDFSVLEVCNDGNNWQLSADIFPFVEQGSKSYGIRGYWSSATTYIAQFGAGGTVSDNATYANNGSEAWSVKYASGTRFRLRRVSGGASVGYPISSANIVGTTVAGVQNLFEQTGTFTATFTQSGGYSQAVTVSYSRIGKTVNLTIPTFSATTTASGAIVAAATLPTELRPSSNRYVMAPTSNSTNYVAAIMGIGSNGDLTVTKDAAGSSFSSGVAGCGLTTTASFSYNIN